MWLTLSFKSVHREGGEGERERERLVNCCFKPSQPQRIISGLKETFIKRDIVERIIEAENKTGRTE